MLSRMGFEVSVVAVFKSPPKAHMLDVLGTQFELLDHAPGSKTVTITEHIAMSDEADAIAFVRSLVADALPDGSTIAAVTAASD